MFSIPNLISPIGAGIVVLLLGGIIAQATAPAWAWTLPLIVVALSAIGWAVLRAYKRVVGFFNKIDRIEQKLARIEQSYYGSDKDALQEGAVNRIKEQEEKLENIESKLDRFLKE